MYLLDDHVVLSPDDLAQCEFALVRQVAEGRGLIPAVEEHVFMGERAAALTGEHRARVVEEYRRKYSRMFTHLNAPRSDSLAALRSHHCETVEELRSLRAVAGGTLVVDVDALVLVSSPAIVLPGTVVDTVLERFARAGDLARLGAHAYAARAATGQEISDAFIHLNNDRRQKHSGVDLHAVAQPRLTHLAGLMSSALTRSGPWPWGDLDVSACGFCARCRAAADEHRDVQLVWGMRRAPRETLRRAGITTIEELAATDSAPGLLDEFSWYRFRDRARLQLYQEDTGEPAAQVHNPSALAALPDPSPGDIFFDFEGDPFWVEKNRFEWGLEFLFGYIEADTNEYVALWSANQAEEKRAFTRFLDYLLQRRAAYPDMHVYHFAFYEPATMRRLARRHRTGQKEVNQLLDDGVFVDLYETVKSAVHTSGRSYGLKALEPLYMGEDLRTSGVTDGGAAVVAYANAVRSRKQGTTDAWQETLDDLADYNRYDCESTRRLRDWLLEQRRENVEDGGLQVAQDLLGATALDSELLIAPLEEDSEDLSGITLEIPGFDQAGIFYVSSGNSTDALGAEHKVHELLGRWGSGSSFASGRDVLVVYSDPETGPTDAGGLLARRAEILESEGAGDMQRIQLREATPTHDPQTHSLVPSFLATGLEPLSGEDASALMKTAKKLKYSVITGPAGAGKTARAARFVEENPGSVVVDDAHQVSLIDALEIAEGAEHVLVVGDPTRATPINRRALPVDVVQGPILSWLLGDSGAKIDQHTTLNSTSRFHRELGAAVQSYLYDDVELAEPPADALRLLPDELAGLHVHTVSHRGNRDSAPEEAAAIADLVKRLLSASPLAEPDLLITAVFDSQVLLLQRELAQWPDLRILPLHETAGEEAAVVILSIGTSTLADAPFGTRPSAPHMPLAPHVLGAALTRARESAFIVYSAHLLEQLPPRGAMFGDVATFTRLYESARIPD